MNAPQTPSHPAWLPNGCPAWCEARGLHIDGDAYEDRTHTGGGITLPLTAEEPLHRDDRDGAQLDVALIQHYREAEPRVRIGRDETSQGTHLSLTEVGTLIGHLSATLATARRGRPPAPGHPAWCAGAECEVYGHMSADRHVGPIVAGLFCSDDGSEPVIHVGPDARLDNHDRPLSVDEAEALGRMLLELAATVRANPIPEGEPWQVAQAREALEASRTAPTTDHAEATRQWGRLEKALGTLLRHVDDRGGAAR